MKSTLYYHLLAFSNEDKSKSIENFIPTMFHTTSILAQRIASVTIPTLSVESLPSVPIPEPTSRTEPGIKWGLNGEEPLEIRLRHTDGNSNTTAERYEEYTWTSVWKDGSRYKLGEAVNIRPSAVACDNQQIQPMRGLICRLTQLVFDRKVKHRVHVQWLRESTIGQQGELFLEHCQCDTLPLSNILSKLDFCLRLADDPITSTEYFAR